MSPSFKPHWDSLLSSWWDEDWHSWMKNFWDRCHLDRCWDWNVFEKHQEAQVEKWIVSFTEDHLQHVQFLLLWSYSTSLTYVRLESKTDQDLIKQQHSLGWVKVDLPPGNLMGVWVEGHSFHRSCGSQTSSLIARNVRCEIVRIIPQKHKVFYCLRLASRNLKTLVLESQAFLVLEQKAAGPFLPDSFLPHSDYTTCQEAILWIISRLRHWSLRTVNETLATSNIKVKQNSQDLIRTHYLNFMWNLTPAPYCVFWFVSNVMFMPEEQKAAASWIQVS